MRFLSRSLVVSPFLLTLCLAVVASLPASAMDGPAAPDSAGGNFNIHRLWEMATAGGAADGLARLAVIAIALLSAFLTVVQVWQIPAPDTRLTDPAQPAATAGDGPLAQAPSTWLSNNFARTVVSGLGGLAVVSFLDASWEKANINARAYFLVLFVLFFLAFLLISAVLRGLLEALRSRVVLAAPPTAWPPAGGGRWNQGVRRVRYLLRRTWTWLLSLRTALLTFGDTFFNLIQGKNQLQTEAFSAAIANLHKSIYWVAARIREDVDRAVCSALRLKGASQEEVEGCAVRVGITLLSADGAWVEYVAREKGSRGQAFDRDSVAWVSVYTGEARWCRLGEEWRAVYAASDVELFNNRARVIPGEAESIGLADHLQNRGLSDYGGFVVLPFPWADRDEPSHHRRGAIQISFAKAEHMELLWHGLEAKGKTSPNFKAWRGLLVFQPGEGTPPEDELFLRDERLAVVLRESLDILAELFGFFNDAVFKERVQPLVLALEN